MLCPSCGTDNPDDSAICSKCGYKFRFGHAYNDPGSATYIDMSKAKTSKSKARVYLLVSIAVLILVLVIVCWARSL